MSARERILARVRDALEDRAPSPHPGAFKGPRPAPPPDPVTGFTDVFSGAGGEVVAVAGPEAAKAWLDDFAAAFAGVSMGAQVPLGLHPARPIHPPESAELGISMAWGAVAETGSLLLEARDGRRTQLLPPTHVVLVPPGSIRATLAEALTALRPALPSAMGLHSGPSKSADIGQILVKGVHGPGRVVALLLGSGP
jgi:L-lactate dehydrogenase complex protein LldG